MVLTVAASNGTVTIGDVYNGETELEKNTHYTVSGGKVTLKKGYLGGLTEGEYTITIKTDQGDVTATVTVVETIEEA